MQSTTEEFYFNGHELRISSTDLKVKTSVHVSIFGSGSETVNLAFKIAIIKLLRFLKL